MRSPMRCDRARPGRNHCLKYHGLELGSWNATDSFHNSDFLQVALDISGNGRLPQPPYAPNIESGIWNITMFLFSYTTGLNLTISNGTTDGWFNSTSEAAEFHCNATTTQGFNNAGCEPIMAQEPGSTVKHVNWAWPDCFVGDGNHAVNASARGPYNVSDDCPACISFSER